jgi:hypothetical protein
VIQEFEARCLHPAGAYILRVFRPGEEIVMQPYVWAGVDEQAFSFNDRNWAAADDVLTLCSEMVLICNWPAGQPTAANATAGQAGYRRPDDE